MNEYSLRLSKPHCDNCHKPKGVKDDLETILTEIERAEPLSLSERLQQTINQAKQEEDEI